MATNVFAGKSGQLLVSATSTSAGSDIGGLRNWNLSVTRETVDATNFDSGGFRELLPGIGQATFTAQTVFLGTGVANQQDELREFLSSETRAYYRVRNTSGTTGIITAFHGYVTNASYSGELRDIQLHDFTVEVDGSWAETS